MTPTGNTLEYLAARDRQIVAAALAVLTVLAWGYTIAMALGAAGGDPHAGMQTGGGSGAMPGMSGMAGMAAWIPWTATEALLIFVMWAVMMVAMMTPSAAPMVLIFARINRERSGAASPVGADAAFAGGYLVLWIAFSVAATVAQWLLHRTALVSPAMASATPLLTAALLIAAGAYQFTPLKTACLAKCRSPIAFMLSEWRNGAKGAFIMGLRHGVYCVGCCWLLFVILFPLGMMNIAVLALVTLLIFAEKALAIGTKQQMAKMLANTNGALGRAGLSR